MHLQETRVSHGSVKHLRAFGNGSMRLAGTALLVLRAAAKAACAGHDAEDWVAVRDGMRRMLATSGGAPVRPLPEN